MNRIGDSLQHTGTNKEFVLAFLAAGVEFILIGGLAVSWYSKERAADDMDLLVNPTPENSARIAQALSKLGISGFNLVSFTRAGLQVPIKQVHYVDLITPKSSGSDYARVIVDAVPAKVFDLPIKVASRTSLIQMKREAIAAEPTKAAKHEQDIKLLQDHLT
jgi:hypothetical protein